MNFLDPFDLVISTLSPVHIGCGEDFVPAEYVVDAKGTLHRFDPAAFGREGNEIIAADILKTLMGEDAAKQMRDVHAVLQRHRERIIPAANTSVPMCAGVFAHYRQTQDPRNDFNRNGIERTAFSPSDQAPYLPGSSIKGSIRTAILNHRIAGNPPCQSDLLQMIRNFNNMIEDYDPGNGRLMMRLKRQYSKRDYDSARKDIEKAIAKASTRLGSNALGGTFETDPLRALKVSDAMPLDQGNEREIRFCLNRNRSGRRSQAQAKNLYTRLEYIREHQPAAFGLTITLQKLQSVAGQRDRRNQPIVPVAENLLTWPEIVKACNDHYLQRLDSDLATVRRLHPSSQWHEQTQAVLDGGLREQIRSGNCILLRVGKHGGADNNTVDGRKIKIMLSEDKRQANGREEKIRLYVFDDEPRTTWYCGDDLDKPSDLLPLGWIVLGSRMQSWHSLLPGYERQRMRQQAAIDSARRLAEAAAAAQAEAEAQAIREAALAAMTPNQRQIKEFSTTCATRAAQLNGAKENPNAAIHNAARNLAKAALEGADWTKEEKSAAADAIEEWLPKLVKVDLKDERKKLKLTALRT